jgi:hypothetical protein
MKEISLSGLSQRNCVAASGFGEVENFLLRESFRTITLTIQI